jgi:undecaprenyl-diphosphatase
MTLLQAILLSVIEGITEFLPVSSTGHLILAGSLLGIPQSEFLSSFEIFIQLGAILGIILLYGKTLLVQKQKIISLSAAFIPTAVIGFLLYKIVKHVLLGNPWIVVGSLIIGGIVLIVFERLYNSQKHLSTPIANLPISKAVGIGIFQTFSIIPGVSRSAATIIGGQLMGLSKKDAVEFSFLLAVPTMAAATLLDLIKSQAFTYSYIQWLYMGVGFLVSCLTAIVVVKVFLNLIQKTNIFLWFGIYRIIIALLYTGIVIR